MILAGLLIVAALLVGAFPFFAGITYPLDLIFWGCAAVLAIIGLWRLIWPKKKADTV